MAVVLAVLSGSAVASLVVTLSIVDAVLVRNLPVPEPHELVVVGSGLKRGIGRGTTPSADLRSYADVTVLRQAEDVLSPLAAVGSFDLSLGIRRRREGQIDLRPEVDRLSIRPVSASYFGLFNVTPAFGRVLNERDDRVGSAARVVVLSADAWREKFAARPDVVGRSIETTAGALTVIGIAPPAFAGERPGRPPDAWAPLAIKDVVDGNPPVVDDPEAAWLVVIGRLRPGADLNAAAGRVNALLHRAFTSRLPGHDASRLRVAEIDGLTIPLVPAPRGLAGGLRPFERPLATVAACAVGAFFLAWIVGLRLWAAFRRRDPGAPVRQRLVCSVLTLAIALAFVGLAIGGGVTAAVFDAFGLHLPLVFDARVALIVIAVCLVVAWPLELGARASAGGRALVWGPVVIAAAVISIAIATNWNLAFRRHRDTGVRVDGLIVAGVHGLDRGRDGTLLDYDAVIEHVRDIENVDAAALSSSMVLSPDQQRESIRVEGAPVRGHTAPTATIVTVTPDFFRAAGVPVLKGRGFQAGDAGNAADVAVVSERLVNDYFGLKPVLGATIGVMSRRLEIVGIAGNALHGSIDAEPQPTIYIPVSRDTTTLPFLYVRTSGCDDRRIVAELPRGAAAAGILLGPTRTMREHIRIGTSADAFVAGFAAVAGFLSLGLAAANWRLWRSGVREN